MKRSWWRSGGSGLGSLCLLVLVLLPAPALSEEVEEKALDPSIFPIPTSFEPNVRFWTLIFTRYDSHDQVFHDELYLDVLYKVLDFSRVDESDLSEVAKRKLKERSVRTSEQKIRETLDELARGKKPSRPQEAERIMILFEKVPGDRSKYRHAKDRLRTQTGLRDRMEMALARSGRYMPALEGAFRNQGLPLELTRMPFVESMFQEGARSKTGAGGIWQIMPGTAKGHLDMNLEVDERYDPLRATEAAAALLQENYELLQTWPLAITAYNHGKHGMARAVRQLGTRDIEIIAARYRSRSFGFASRNFYSEFLAAVKVYADRDRYFPELEPEAPLAFDPFVPEEFVPARELALGAGSDLDLLKELNPAFAPEVWKGALWLPSRYELRVPSGTLPRFEQAYAELPAEMRSPHQRVRWYTVRRGDTLGAIASRFGTSVKALQQANRLKSRNVIRVGQRLMIPGSVGSGSASSTHTVRRGESLSSIARRYGVTVAQIKAANSLASNTIHPGQRLAIPARR